MFGRHFLYPEPKDAVCNGKNGPASQGDNIKVDIKETGLDDMGWVFLAQNKGDRWALMNKITDILAPSNDMDFFTS